MKCYAKSSVNLIARLANLHPKTTFFIKVFSFVFLVPEKRIIFAKVQRRIKSKIRLSYRLSFKLLVVNQSNMLHRKLRMLAVSSEKPSLPFIHWYAKDCFLPIRKVRNSISMKTNFFLGLRTGVERVQNRLTRRCWQICKAVSVISPNHP